MKHFADFLSGPLEAPLADETHLTGKYDLQLEFAALKGELGLQITPRKTKFDVIIVDHVDDPTPN